YEKGFNLTNLASGLPVAGTTFTNASAPDRFYTMAPSYTANDAVLVDSNSPTATITIATPSRYSALSLLNASANGNATLQCVATFADLTSQTNVFTSPDWFNNVPVAYTAAGRVNLQTAIPNSVNSSNPRLYFADF